MKNTMTLARKYGAKITVASTALFCAAMSHAAGEASGITAALDAVDLSGVATKVGAAALLIVGIALVFKGPDIAKRIVRKV